MNFIDEKDVTGADVGENSHQVALFDECGTGGGADVCVHFVCYDMGEGCFAESGRAVEQDMFERFRSLSGGLDGDGEFFLDVFLADTFIEGLRAQGDVEVFLLGVYWLICQYSFYGHCLVVSI